MAAPSQAAEAELESATSPPRTISEREFNEGEIQSLCDAGMQACTPLLLSHHSTLDCNAQSATAAMALLSGGEDSQYLLYSFQDYWKSGKVPKELVDPGSIIWEHWEQVTGAQAAILRAAVFCCRKMFDDNSNRRFAEKLSGFQGASSFSTPSA